jgi:spore maturation protein A
MKQLAELSGHTGRASDAMCTFLVLNAAGLTILPTTVLGLRLAQNSQAPAAFLPAMILTGLTGTAAALLADRLLSRRRR